MLSSCTKRTPLFEPDGVPLFADGDRHQRRQRQQEFADYLARDDGYAAWELSLTRVKTDVPKDPPPSDDVQGMSKTIASLALIALSILAADYAVGKMQSLVSSHVAQLDQIR